MREPEFDEVGFGQIPEYFEVDVVCGKAPFKLTQADGMEPGPQIVHRSAPVRV